MTRSRSKSSFLPALAAVVLSAPALLAQVPIHHIVTAESGLAPDGFRYVDPVTGSVTNVTETMNNFLGAAETVAVSAIDATGLYTSAGGSFGGAPLWRLEMAGSVYDLSASTGGVVPYFGAMGRMHVTRHGVLFTLSSVSDGVYRMTDVAASPTLLHTLSNALDIAVIGDLAYVNTYVAGQPSTVVEIDLVTSAVRTLGGSYPTIRSLGTFGGTLIAGMDNGELYQLDPTSGTLTLLVQTGRPAAIIAIAEGDTAADAYFASSAGEVYRVVDPSTLVYASPYTLMDIDVGRRARAELYGQGCPGSNGVPTMTPTFAPTLGSTYLLEVSGTQPNALTPLVLGFQRTSIDLTPYGFNGCTLLNDHLSSGSARNTCTSARRCSGWGRR